MGILTFILGRSGTGKTTSLRNFEKDEVAVVNVQGKVLPFKGSGAIKTVNTDQSDEIVKEIKSLVKQGYKRIVVDDFQYVMANEFMRRASERGYDKFTEIARHAWDIPNVVNELPNDVIVYILCHTDTDAEGTEKLKTIGKMLDEKICLEGMSAIVLKTNVCDGQYTFLTQNNGKDTVKSPAGMFPSYTIDNDLKYVDEKIRNYFEIGDYLTDEEMAEIDEEVKREGTPFEDDGKKKRSRRNKKVEENEEVQDTDEEKKTSRTARSRRNKSVSDDVTEREKIIEKNEQAIVESGFAEAGDKEEVPFEDVAPPEQEKVPRRKRRGVSEQEQTLSEEEESSEVEETKEPTEENTRKTRSSRKKTTEEDEEETSTPRRRRRRS